MPPKLLKEAIQKTAAPTAETGKAVQNDKEKQHWLSVLPYNDYEANSTIYESLSLHDTAFNS